LVKNIIVHKSLSFLVICSVSITFAILIVALSEKGILPWPFFFVGPLMIITIGIVFVLKARKKKFEVDEMLLKVNPIRFNLDHVFFDKHGKKYFYFKSFFLGIFFIICGILIILKKVFY